MEITLQRAVILLGVIRDIKKRGNLSLRMEASIDDLEDAALDLIKQTGKSILESDTEKKEYPLQVPEFEEVI